MKFKDRLRTLREDLGLSQRGLANKMGIHFAQLARYEYGRTKPSLDILVKLAKFYEVSTDYLIFGVDKSLSKRAKVDDLELIEILRRIDQLKKPQREKVKWAIEALIDRECQEQSKDLARTSEQPHKVAKSA